MPLFVQSSMFQIQIGTSNFLKGSFPLTSMQAYWDVYITPDNKPGSFIMGNFNDLVVGLNN
jgi:hypothetical protein